MRKPIAFALIFAQVVLSSGCALIWWNGRPEPVWIHGKAPNALFYYGVGGPADTLDKAKDSARMNAAKSIEVEVEGIIIRWFREFGEEVNDEFIKYSRTYVRRKLPEPVIIDHCRSKEGYWALARVSREKVEEMVDKSAQEKLADVRNRSAYADECIRNGKVINAIKEYHLAYKDAEILPGKFGWLDREKELRYTVHLERMVNELAEGINVKAVSGCEQKGLYGFSLSEELVISATYWLRDDERPIKGLPLNVSFERGKGILWSGNLSGEELSIRTDENGKATFEVEKILSISSRNRIQVRIDPRVTVELDRKITDKIKEKAAYFVYSSVFKSGTSSWRPTVLLNGSSDEFKFESGDRYTLEITVPRSGMLHIMQVYADGSLQYDQDVPMVRKVKSEEWEVLPWEKGWLLRIAPVKVLADYGEGIETLIAVFESGNARFRSDVKLSSEGVIRELESASPGEWGAGWASYLISSEW